MIKTLLSLRVAGSVLVLATFTIGTVSAQNYPSGNIRVVGIATAGATSDIIGRVVAEPLARQLGHQVLIDQRGGAGGTLAAGIVARSEPDGYTLLLTSSAQSGMTWLYSKLAFNPVKDFAGVATLADLPSAIVVPPQRNWNSLNDLIAAAKARPGALNFGSGGVGSGTHLNSEKFMLGAGISANHVPYKGMPAVLVEIMAGRLDWLYAPAPSAVSLVKEGKVKALVVSSKTRMEQLPDVPTGAEAGVPGAEHVFWIGVLAPRKTPPAVVAKLNAEIGKILRTPELRERFRQLGAQPLVMQPAEFDRFLAADTEAAGRVVKAANIQPN